MSKGNVVRYERMRANVDAMFKAGRMPKPAYDAAVKTIKDAIDLEKALPSRERGNTRENVLKYATDAKLDAKGMKEVGDLVARLDADTERLAELIGSVPVAIGEGNIYAGLTGNPDPRWFCNVVPTKEAKEEKAKRDEAKAKQDEAKAKQETKK